MDKNKERKKRLNKYCPKFKETVDPKEILCYFHKMPQGVKESIMCKTINGGCEEGALEFCMSVTKADSDWYDCLMEALREKEYTELLNLLQDDEDNQHPLDATNHIRSPVTSQTSQMNSNPHQEMINSGTGDMVTASTSQHSFLGVQPLENDTQYASQQQTATYSPSPHQRPGAQLRPSNTPSSPQTPTWTPQQTTSSPEPESDQRYTASSPIPHKCSSQQQTRLRADIQHSQRTPTSPGSNSKECGDDQTENDGSQHFQSHQQNTATLHKQTSNAIHVNDLTLGQAQQGVREAFNNKMNDKMHNNNWKSLAARLGMSVDEVDTIHDASQLYEKLKTSEMKLVELVYHLQEMGRVDLISDIRQFHDLSQMSQTAEQTELSKRQKEEENLEKLNINLPEAKSHEINRTVKEIKHENGGDRIAESVEVNASANASAFTRIDSESPAAKSSSDPPMEHNARKYLRNHREESNRYANKRSGETRVMMPTVQRCISVESCGGTLPLVGTSAPDTLNVHNQPPCDSVIEQSGSFIPESVQLHQIEIDDAGKHQKEKHWDEEVGGHLEEKDLDEENVEEHLEESGLVIKHIREHQEEKHLDENVDEHPEESVLVIKHIREHREERRLDEDDVEEHWEESGLVVEHMGEHREERRLVEEDVEKHREESGLVVEHMGEHREERRLVEEEVEEHREESGLVVEHMGEHREERRLVEEDVEEHREESGLVVEHMGEHREERRLVEEDVDEQEVRQPCLLPELRLDGSSVDPPSPEEPTEAARTNGTNGHRISNSTVIAAACAGAIFGALVVRQL